MLVSSSGSTRVSLPKHGRAYLDNDRARVLGQLPAIKRPDMGKVLNLFSHMPKPGNAGVCCYGIGTMHVELEGSF